MSTSPAQASASAVGKCVSDCDFLWLNKQKAETGPEKQTGQRICQATEPCQIPLQQFEMLKKTDLCHFILIINTCLKSLLKGRSLDIPYMFLFVFSSGCKRSMNHLKEGLDHEAKHRCRYSAQYDNRIYTCKASTNPHNALM